MPRSRAETATVAARRVKLLEYRTQRRPYPTFYKELGYASVNAARRDFNRTVESNLAEVQTSVEVWRETMLMELDDLAAEARTIMDITHYSVTQGGKVARHPETDEPLRDYGPNLAAMDRLLKIQDRIAKITGCEAAMKIEVLTIDDIDQNIRALTQQLAVDAAEAEALAATEGTASRG